MSLSFSAEANKGVYALLLGSGISSAAAIPTGWGILKELCKRIMLLNGEDESDAIKWYEKKYNKTPLYDEVIGMLAKTSSERNGLLKEFFEPTEEDIKQNRKLPTKAHRSIAKLVKKGYIKVIVTTNFDRLIEQSLDELNIQYQTLYHESDIEGMKPLAHAECTVLKIHGDYRDTRFKNVADELKIYSQSLTEILKKIFDEYGLIISGWSSEWDTALRDTIKSVKGRRYSWYWHSFSNKLTDKAQELADFRDASIIVDGLGADHFFDELSQNIDSISKFKKSNPEFLQVKIRRLKNYLNNKQEIEITELITNETKKVSEYFNNINYDNDSSKKFISQRVEEIKEKSKPLATLISLVSFNVQSKRQEQLLIETLERLTLIKNHTGTTNLLYLQQIPLQITLYSIGIALVKSNNYNLLNRIFVAPKVRDEVKKGMDFPIFVSPYRGLGELFRFLYLENEYYLPMEQFMNSYLEEILLENKIMFDVEEYNIFYDYFEFLRCVKYYYLGIKNHYLMGKFGFKYDMKYIELFVKEGSMEKNWDVLVLCGGNNSEFAKVLKMLAKELNTQGFTGKSLIEAYEEKDF